MQFWKSVLITMVRNRSLPNKRLRSNWALWPINTMMYFCAKNLKWLIWYVDEDNEAAKVLECRKMVQMLQLHAVALFFPPNMETWKPCVLQSCWRHLCKKKKKIIERVVILSFTINYSCNNIACRDIPFVPI